MVLLRIVFNLDREMYGDGKKLDAEMIAAAFPRGQAEKMDQLPGLIWKLWTTQPDECRAAGFYLFATREDAENRKSYADHSFTKFPGISNVHAEIYDVMEDFSRITRGPIDLPANPSLSK